MTETFLHGNPPLNVTVRRSAQARRLSLRVSRLDGQIKVTLPKRVPLTEAKAFVADREPWLRAQLAEVPPSVTPGLGDVMQIGGQAVTLCAGTGRRAEIDDDRLHLPQRAPMTALVAYLKDQARVRLVGASDHYAGLLGLRYGRITLRDTRSRWGSCSGRGDLMYSWRLILAPSQVLNYVAAHEVAHLQEMNHSPAFWAIVARLDPDWRASRDWLRHNGTDLHRYRFTD